MLSFTIRLERQRDFHFRETCLQRRKGEGEKERGKEGGKDGREGGREKGMANVSAMFLLCFQIFQKTCSELMPKKRRNDFEQLNI